ncbi:MAG: hypothetical protein QXE75_03625 [Sulfolobales archaeon]
MISLRLMYSDKDERKEALKLAKFLMRVLEKRGYIVKSNMKMYKNRRNDGGRIYISLKKD